MSGKWFTRRGPGRSHAGPAPREDRSGTSARKPLRLSQLGNSRLREALDLPALATRLGPLVAAFDGRPVAAGHTKAAAAGEGPRELLMIADGVPKSRTTIDPARGSKITA